VKYPDECPVFRVSKKIKTGHGGKLAVGIDFYGCGLVVDLMMCNEGDAGACLRCAALLTCSSCDESYSNQPALHYRWLQPLTPAARAMKNILRRNILSDGWTLFPK
jgi:uncharacterized paraquat-inducible protein A